MRFASTPILPRIAGCVKYIITFRPSKRQPSFTAEQLATADAIKDILKACPHGDVCHSMLFGLIVSHMLGEELQRSVDGQMQEEIVNGTGENAFYPIMDMSHLSESVKT